MSTRSSRFRFGGDVVVLGQLAVPLVILTLWQVLAISVSGFALATPIETWEALLGGIRSGWMVEGLERTITEQYIAGVQTAPMLAIIVVLVIVATVVNVGFFVLENRLGARNADTAQMA